MADLLLPPLGDFDTTLLSKWSCINMRHAVDPLQGRLFDPFQQIIPPLGLKYLANGWQSIFRAVLLPLMPVGKLGDRLHPILGRRSKELYALSGTAPGKVAPCGAAGILDGLSYRFSGQPTWRRS